MKSRRFNWVLSDYTRVGLKKYMEWMARLKGQRFYCKALGGESDYNITVNCDLTVSCSCQDYDGSGHLGDLNKNSFKEVFFGPTARRFREDLANGKLPIDTCTRCGDLHRVSRNSVNLPDAPVKPSGGGKSAPSAEELDPANHIFAGPKPRLPHRGMLLENTVRCNIDCVGCDRESAARIRSFPQMDMPRLERMADLVNDLKLEQLFYLNLGEPFLSPNIGQELPLLRRKNPNCRIVISTNGIILRTDAQREAALSASHIFFSIAGISDAMLMKYEKRGSFEKAYQNMKALVDYRNKRGLSQPILEWKYLLFNWNDRRSTIAHAIEMAKDAGVDAISFWPTHNPFYGWSYRYAWGWLNHVGVKNWKGREVDLRKPATEPPKSNMGLPGQMQLSGT